MGFNEKVHAFIAAKFYVYLTEAFGDRGEKGFYPRHPALCRAARPAVWRSGQSGTAVSWTTAPIWSTANG